MSNINNPRNTIRTPDYAKSALPDDIILTERQAKFLGLEEAPADLGPSWEEYYHRQERRRSRHV